MMGKAQEWPWKGGGRKATSERRSGFVDAGGGSWGTTGERLATARRRRAGREAGVDRAVPLMNDGSASSAGAKRRVAMCDTWHNAG